MGYFQVRYDSRVANYNRRSFIRLATDYLPFKCTPACMEEEKEEKHKSKNHFFGSGCGSVGKAVTSNTRGPRFKPSHQQKFIYIEHLSNVNCELKRQK